jgi:hypothetical protein
MPRTRLSGFLPIRARLSNFQTRQGPSNSEQNSCGLPIMLLRTIGKLLLVLTLVLCCCPIMLAQTTFGSIGGAVTDSSAAPIPGVKMTLTNIDTNGRQVTETNAAGIFEFVNVLPGNYRIDAEKAAFQHFSRAPIVVQVQQSYRIDVTLPLGAVAETVNVAATTPLLQPQTSSLGQVIAGRSVTEMPLNGRNVFNLMELAPSVVPQGGALGTYTGSGVVDNAFDNFQVGGAFAGWEGFYLDGAPENVGFIDQASFAPTQDSIQEFNMQTNNLGPEWGHFVGGVMNLTTKSGTNQIHGEAYEYLRNKKLNANTFFNNQSGIPTGAFTQNQFGANVGAPFIIPGVYNGKDKTFWFLSWEGFRLRQGITYTDTVPTPAELVGDFSQLKDASGKLIPIYNPLTVCGQLGNPSCAIGANGQPTYIRQPFPGNVIPASMLNPAALKLENLWAAPNTAGQPFTNVSNFNTAYPGGGNNNQVVARVDQNVSDKQHFFARFSYWDDLNLAGDPFKTGVCTSGTCTVNLSAYDGVVDDTYTLNPTTVVDLHMSVDRWVYLRNPLRGNFDLTSIGWPASLNASIPAFARTPPTPVVQGEANSLFSGQGLGSVNYAHTVTWGAAGDLTKIIGRHMLKAGAQLIAPRANRFQTNTASGTFTFDSGYTQQGPLTPGGGFGLASFLLGYPSLGSEALASQVAGQQIYRAVYFGDTWQVTKRLTFNLGLRYEQDGPWSERFNRLSYWDLSATNPLAAATGLPLKGAVGLVASPQRSSRNNINMSKTEFSPRVGFGYRLTDSTVLRGGYGIFRVPLLAAAGFGFGSEVDPTEIANTPFVASTNGGITPVGTLSNPFPNGVNQPPGRSPNLNQQVLNLGGATIGSPDSNWYGYTQQWNLDVQVQLPQGFFLDAAYAGTKGVNLYNSSLHLNQLPDQYLSLGSALLTQVPNPFLGLIQSGPLATATIAAGQLLLPHPQYSTVNLADPAYATSSYHSLQVKVTRKFNQGGALLVAYTFSKFLTDGDTEYGYLEGNTGGKAAVQDWNCIKCEYGLDSQDVPQRLVISYVQNLPFGQSQRFLSGVRGLTGKLVSGWGVDGITTFQSGFPLKFTTAVNLTNSFGGGSRPNVVLGCNSARSGSVEQRLTQWFNTACFAQPPAFTFGNESRVDPHLRMQGITNFDFALFKNTTFGPEGKLAVQFRTEFFNLFNTPQFGPPGQALGNAQFGIVSSQVNNPRLIQFALKFLF